MRIVSLVLMSILIAATGCATPEEQTAVPVARLGNSTVGYLSNSGIREKRVLVVRNDAEWQRAWGTLHANRKPVPALPAIDFAEKIAVVYALGEQVSGGFSVRIISAALSGNNLQLIVEIRRPSPTCIVTSSITAPADVILLPRSEKTVLVEEVVVESAC